MAIAVLLNLSTQLGTDYNCNMKGFQFLVFAAVFAVSLARVYDDKSDAIKQIQEKFKGAENLQKTILDSIKTELQNTNSVKGESDLINQLKVKVNETKVQFEEDADSTIRTAIVLAKPITVIDCIRKVSDQASNDTAAFSNINEGNIKEIKTRKIQKIGFDSYAVNAIIKGLKELKEQAIQKIQNNEGVLATVKKEALDRCDSAILLLGEIEIRVNEPVLSNEYIKMRQQIERELKELRTKLSTELNNCLNKPKGIAFDVNS